MTGQRMPFGERDDTETYVVVVPGYAYAVHGPFDFDTAQAQRAVILGSHVVKMTRTIRPSTWTRKKAIA